MAEEMKKKIYTILLAALALFLTLLIVQGISYLFDLLRAHTGVPPITATTEVSKDNIQDVIPALLNTPIIDQTDLQKFRTYKQISIYPNGIETPSNFTNNTSSAQIALENAGRNISIVGDIDDAYIYIKLGANDGSGSFTKIMPQFDNVWFYVEDGKFLGGQLDLSKSLFDQPSEFTELLYNLKQVPVAKDVKALRNGNFQTLNLISELKDNRKIGALVSTARYGKVVQLIIGYSCKGDDDSCSIH